MRLWILYQRVFTVLIVNIVHGYTSFPHVTSVTGNVYLAGIFTLKSSTRTGSECDGQAVVTSVMALELVKWAIRRLNEHNYIPGVKIGLLTFPSCMSDKLVGYRAVEISSIIQERTKNIIGIIGAETNSQSEWIATILAGLPQSVSPPMISYSSTAAILSDVSKFPNFFRTIPSDRIQVKVMASLLVELEWNYISIVHENKDYNRQNAETLQEMLREKGVCIRSVNSFNTTYGVEMTTLGQIVRDIILPKGGAVSGVVFFGGETSAEKFLTVITNLHLGRDTPSLIFSSEVGLSKHTFNAKTLPASRGNLIVRPTSQPIKQFLEYWKTIFRNKTLIAEELKTNPYMEDVFSIIKGCSFDDVSCDEPTEVEIEAFTSDYVIYDQYVLDAVCIFANTLKNLRHEVCLNDACSLLKYDGLKEISTALKKVDVNSSSEFGSIFHLNDRLKFNENGELRWNGNTDIFSVYNHRKCLQDESSYCFTQVATFSENIVVNRTLLKDYDQTGMERRYHKAQCRKGDICTACLQNNEELYYKPGDLVIVAAFPIHNVGYNPLKCGGLRRNIGFDVALSVEYVVEEINNDSTIFNGTSVGFLILDTCNDPLIIQERMLRLFRHDNYSILPHDILDRILGFVGPFGSTQSIPMVSLTNKLQGKPHVGCCATTTKLSNRELYPNFLRVSMTLDKTAEAMIQIAKTLNAFYIQIVYSSGEYGEGGREAIEISAKKHGICVANAIEVPDRSNYIAVIDNLRVKPSAKVVLTFLRSFGAPYVMQVITENMQSDDEFHFIASETLAPRKDFLIPRLRGTLAVAQEMPQNPGYLQYLKSKYPKPTDSNSWLLDIIQSRQRCFFPWSFNKSSVLTRPCGPTDHLSNNDINAIDPWAPYLLNAAQALLKASASALREICKTTKYICPGYHETQRVVQHIRNVHLDINQNGSYVPVFDEHGNGVYGYKIYQIVLDGNLSYKLVGQWSPSSGLIFDKHEEILSESKSESRCPNHQDCSFCKQFLHQINTDIGYQNLDSSDRSTGFIVGITVATFLAVLFLSMFWFQCYRNRRDEVDPNAPYLDVFQI